MTAQWLLQARRKDHGILGRCPLVSPLDSPSPRQILSSYARAARVCSAGHARLLTAQAGQFISVSGTSTMIAALAEAHMQVPCLCTHTAAAVGGRQRSRTHRKQLRLCTGQHCLHKGGSQLRRCDAAHGCTYAAVQLALLAGKGGVRDAVRVWVWARESYAVWVWAREKEDKGSENDHGAAVQEDYPCVTQQQSNRHPVKYFVICCFNQKGQASATSSRLCSYRSCILKPFCRG
jgi:hypothetical protein